MQQPWTHMPSLKAQPTLLAKAGYGYELTILYNSLRNCESLHIPSLAISNPGSDGYVQSRTDHAFRLFYEFEFGHSG